MIDRALVHAKLTDLKDSYQKLEQLLQAPSREIIEDYLKLHTTERLFQLIVDIAIDTNTHLIAELGFSVPDDYQNTFLTLAEHHVLPMDFALALAPSVGLRNLIVHKYGKVDLKRMIDDIRNGIGQYRQYMRYIDAFLEKSP